CPGDLLHIDVKTYSRFDSPGHALTGDRSRPGREKRKHLGQDYAHAVVDDHSRLAFSELYPDERAGSVVQFVKRASLSTRATGSTSTGSLPTMRGATPKTMLLPSCSCVKASSTGRFAPLGRAPMGRWSASTSPWRVS